MARAPGGVAALDRDRCQGDAAVYFRCVEKLSVDLLRLMPLSASFQLLGEAELDKLVGGFAVSRRRLLELFASFRAEDGTPLLPVNLVDVAERPPEAVRPLGDRLRQWVMKSWPCRS